MGRIFALALALVLPGCAISPPSSMFASLGGNDEPKVQQPPASAPASARTQQAGLGSSLSGWWDSVKSSFGADEDEEASPPVGAKPAFDPAAAQKLVNAYRTQKGLKPLKLNPKLSEAAKKHSEDLAKSDRISHYGSDGSDAWDRVGKVGYGARLTAENVGTGQKSLEEVFQGWQKSRDHNANLLLGDAEEMGIAMVYKPDTQFKTFWTMVLGSPRATN